MENLISLAKEGSGSVSLDLNDTVKDAVRLFLLDSNLRRQIVEAFTEDDRLHIEELNSLLEVRFRLRLYPEGVLDGWR